jgi:hypothetical protein
MDNPEKLATFGTQVTTQIQIKQKTQHKMCWTPLCTRQRQTELKHNTKCVGHHYTQANTNNVNKT